MSSSIIANTTSSNAHRFDTDRPNSHNQRAELNSKGSLLYRSGSGYPSDFTKLKNCLSLQGLPNVILLKMLAEHRSGSLTIRDPNDASVAWRIFLDQGKIVFAESVMGKRERLAYLLKLLMNGKEVNITWPQNLDTSDYSILCNIWSNHCGFTVRLEEVLAYGTQEALIQIFALPKCEILFDSTAYFPPIIRSESFSALINPIEPWIGQWRGIRPEIHSPFQRLYIKNWDRFLDLISYAQSKYSHLYQLNLALGENHTLYSLAHHLNIDAQELAVALHPLVKAGAVGVRPYQEVDTQKPKLIACINQNAVIQNMAQRTLKRSGYEVLPIMNPQKALSILRMEKPAMAIVDSALTQSSSFRLCRKIRRFQAFEKLPLVMMLNSNQILAQTRGKICGASDFLRNPLRPQDLLKCVNHWTSHA